MILLKRHAEDSRGINPPAESGSTLKGAVAYELAGFSLLQLSALAFMPGLTGIYAWAN